MARRLGVEAQDLQELNGIADPRSLEVGDALKLPPVTNVGAPADKEAQNVPSDDGAVPSSGVEPVEQGAAADEDQASAALAAGGEGSAPELAVSASSPGTRSSQVERTSEGTAPRQHSSSSSSSSSSRPEKRWRSLHRRRSRRRRDGQGGPALARLRAIIDEDKAREAADKAREAPSARPRRRGGLRT